MLSKRFKRMRRKEKKELDVDITSLLDILVILLVFLLKSYNPTDLKLDVASNIQIPSSSSESLGHTALTVQVSADLSFWINNEKMGNLSRTNHKEKTYPKLAAALGKRAPANVTNKKMESGSQHNDNKVNLVFDHSLPYEVIQKVMHTSALSGYTQYKFIVQGRYQ